MKASGFIKRSIQKKADIKLSLDEDEEIDTLWLDLETAFEYTRNGKIDDGKTVIAISQMMAERN